MRTTPDSLEEMIQVSKLQPLIFSQELPHDLRLVPTFIVLVWHVDFNLKDQSSSHLELANSVCLFFKNSL